MDAVFLKLLNMSIAASWLILAVIVLRLLLKKAPKAILCALWVLVAIRLICPFSFESAVSLIPSAETLPQEVISGNSFDVKTGLTIIDAPVNEYLGGHYFDGVTVPAGYGSNLMETLGLVWLAGAALMLVYAVISYLRLNQRVKEGISLRGNIWICDRIDTPFILGVLRPRIFLPSSMEEEQSDYVIAHENAHLKRHDHWWKPFGFVLLSVHWFNPICWLAYCLLCKDIEMACDEKVIKDLDTHNKKAYSEALLSCSVPRRMIAACPLAFGEVSVKERIKTVLNYRKPAFWIVLAAVVACMVMAMCFLSNPVSYLQEIKVGETVYTQTGKAVSELPEGSTELGSLDRIQDRTKEHPTENFTGTNLDSKYTGNKIYQSGADSNTILLEDDSGFYLPFLGESSISLTGDAEQTGLSYEAAFSWVNYSEEGFEKFVDRSLNKASMEISSIQHLPIVRLDDKAELDAFYEEMQPYFSLDEDYDESVSFQTQAAHYDDAFFETSTLFVIHISENSGSNRHSIKGVWTENSSFSVGINRLVPEVGDTAMAGWFISVAVAKKDISDSTHFNAYVSDTIDSNTVSPADGSPALSLSDVVTLSQKGEDLMWEDFDGYAYLETGSGLYIRVYEINAQYSLWIGGGSTTGKPVYIRLMTNTDEYIDIRTEDVTTFIDTHTPSGSGIS